MSEEIENLKKQVACLKELLVATHAYLSDAWQEARYYKNQIEEALEDEDWSEQQAGRALK